MDSKADTEKSVTSVTKSLSPKKLVGIKKPRPASTEGCRKLQCRFSWGFLFISITHDGKEWQLISTISRKLERRELRYGYNVRINDDVIRYAPWKTNWKQN